MIGEEIVVIEGRERGRELDRPLRALALRLKGDGTLVG